MSGSAGTAMEGWGDITWQGGGGDLSRFLTAVVGQLKHVQPMTDRQVGVSMVSSVL